MTNKRPADIFFGESLNTTYEKFEKTKLDNVKKLKDKQRKDLDYRNRKSLVGNIKYKIGQIV